MMKFSKITGKISSFFNHRTGIVITSVALTIGAGQILPSNAPDKIWDNEPTEKTSEVMTEMQQNIADLTVLGTHLGELEPEMDRLEKKNTKNKTWAKNGLTEEVLENWLIYTIEKSNVMMEFDARAQPFLKKELEFIREILTNNNIPEDKALELIENYIATGVYSGVAPLPSKNKVHLLREMQKENPDLDAGKIYKDLQDKNVNGHFRIIPVMIAIFGCYFLAGGSKKWDENVKKKEGITPEENNISDIDTANDKTIDVTANDVKNVANDDTAQVTNNTTKKTANNATKNTLKPKS